MHLDGNWTVDGLSRDGRRLYLIEYEQSGYRVRVHDAAQGLLPDPITDPREPEPMTGAPWASIGSPDGRWQLTLYLKAGSDETEPFVHALSLGDSRAACLDLPGGDFTAAGRYALVLAPNGRTLYAANPSLGVVATIDLQRKAVVSTVRFKPLAARNGASSAAFGAVSPDGRTVYFTAGEGVLAYDANARAVRGPYDVGAVAGIGFEPAGRNVLVVKANGSKVWLRAKNGSQPGSRS